MCIYDSIKEREKFKYLTWMFHYIRKKKASRWKIKSQCLSHSLFLCCLVLEERRKFSFIHTHQTSAEQRETNIRKRELLSLKDEVWRQECHSAQTHTLTLLYIKCHLNYQMKRDLCSKWICLLRGENLCFHFSYWITIVRKCS